MKVCVCVCGRRYSYTAARIATKFDTWSKGSSACDCKVFESIRSVLRVWEEKNCFFLFASSFFGAKSTKQRMRASVCGGCRSRWMLITGTTDTDRPYIQVEVLHCPDKDKQYVNHLQNYRKYRNAQLFNFFLWTSGIYRYIWNIYTCKRGWFTRKNGITVHSVFPVISEMFDMLFILIRAVYR